jgi:hypothetical protein
MKRINTLICLILLMANIALYGQNKNIGGKVVNEEDGQAFSLARVTMVHAKKTVFTDKEGRFEFMNVKLPDTLLISYIGYERILRTITQAKDDYVFNLKAQKFLLNEVVVNTGYQKIAVGKATGSYSLIDSALLNRQVGTDVFRRLEGVTPSLLYDHRGSEGGLVRFSVRWISSLTSNNSPLIVR